MAVIFGKEWDSDLDRYRKAVSEIATSTAGGLFVNTTTAHAKVVLAQLFKEAREEVLISTNYLPVEVYGSK